MNNTDLIAIWVAILVQGFLIGYLMGRSKR